MGAWGPARVRTDRAHRGDQRRVLVVGRRIAGLGRQLARMGDEVTVVRDEHAATHNRHWCGLPAHFERVMILVAVEGEDARLAQRAGAASLVRCAQGLGCILDQVNAICLTGSQNGLNLGALPVEMDQHHGPGQTALLVALGQRLRQQRRIHVPGEPFAVDEGRPGVQVEDRVGAGHKGKGGDQNLVARINAIQAQG